MLVGLPVERPLRRYDVQLVWLLCCAKRPRLRQSMKFLVHRLPPDDRMLIRARFLVRLRRENLAHWACGHEGMIVRWSMVEQHMTYTYPRCRQRQQPLPRPPLAPHSFPLGPTPPQNAGLRTRDISTQGCKICGCGACCCGGGSGGGGDDNGCDGGGGAGGVGDENGCDGGGGGGKDAGGGGDDDSSGSDGICLMHGGDDDPNSATSTAAVNFDLYLGRGGRERETSDTWRQTRPRCTSSGRTRYSLRDVELGRARGTESEKNVDKIEYKGKHPWCEYVPGIILKIGHFTLHLLKINR